MKKSTRILIIENVLNSQDIGGKTKQTAIECAENCEKLSDKDTVRDPLTAYLVSSIGNVSNTTIDDIETDFDYAISMLQRAKRSLNEVKNTVFDREALGI